MRAPANDDSATSAALEHAAWKHAKPLRSALNSGAAFAGLVYLLLVGLLVIAIRGMTGGHFVYTLDDPYIHLALAERIRSGLYGLNAGEPASPSSSIIWPLLFVPFARTAWVEYLPLCLNVVLGLGVVGMLGACVRRIFRIGPEQTDTRARMLVLLLVFALNLPGLTLTGLEHVLQVLLSVCCAYAVLCLLDSEPVPTSTLLAAVMLPSVRYEGLLVTVAVAVALVGARRWRLAASVLLGSLVVPVCFSVYLRHLGLPAFPLSVLLKSSAAVQSSGSLIANVLGTGIRTALDTLRSPERAPELILTVVLVYLLYRNRSRRLPFACTLAGLVVALVQTVAGPNGWFFRYEVAALAFILLVAIALDVRIPLLEAQTARHRPTGALLVGVAALAAVYMQPLLASPAAALGIYEQQYQIGRLTRDYLHGAAAVNDLGLASFRRPPSRYLFDLYGLGSYESARVKPSQKTPEWLDSVVREHGVELVAIYPEWFKRGLPFSWVAVGKLCSPHAPVSAYSSRVMLYATSAARAQALRPALRSFAATLPKEVTLDIDPTNAYNTCPTE